MFEEGKPAGISFTMQTDYGVRDFVLPVKTEGVLAAMRADSKVPRSKCTPEQAAKVAWRTAKDWLAAQQALIDAELATLDEVMMPYLVVDAKGNTAYLAMRTEAMRAIEGGRKAS